jgi:hypothetical protein
VLYGGQTPFVLRREAEGKFRFIGFRSGAGGDGVRVGMITKSSSYINAQQRMG